MRQKLVRMRWLRLRHLKRLAMLMFASTATLGIPATASAQPLPMVTIDAARLARDKGESVLVDIREPSEHAQGVAAGAILMPMGQIASRLNELPSGADKPLHIICNTQNRSSRVVAALRGHGFTNASYVKGGMSEWYQRRLPMVSPVTK